MNRQQILSRLASTYPVLYSTGPWTIWNRRDPEFSSTRWHGSFDRRHGVLVDRPSKLLLSWPTRAMWENFITQRVANRWTARLAREGAGPLVAYVCHPRFVRYVRALRADLCIYSPYDLFSRTPDWSDSDRADEAELLQLSSFVFASSRPTQRELQSISNKEIHYIPNGVNAELFIAGARGPAPPDLAAVPRPRIGYVGTLNRKVDFALIARLARREPGWNIVLLGPRGSLDDVTSSGLAECRRLPNVHVLAERSMEKLPACLGALDVGLMCYRKNTWADVGYPLKMNEYLAAGLPVVSTRLLSIAEYEQVVDMVEGDDDWHAAIARAVAGEGRADAPTRRAVAIGGSWDLRVAAIDEILQAALRSGQPSH